MSEDNRHHERHALHGRVIVMDTSPAPVRGTLSELSEQGAGLMLENQLAAGTVCTVHCQIPTAHGFEYLTVRARIVFAVLVGSSSLFRTGVAFAPPDAAVQATLQRILRKR